MCLDHVVPRRCRDRDDGPVQDGAAYRARSTSSLEPDRLQRRGRRQWQLQGRRAQRVRRVGSPRLTGRHR